MRRWVGVNVDILGEEPSMDVADEFIESYEKFEYDPVLCDCCGKEVDPEELRGGFCIACQKEMREW